jgi:rod shape-determining protein MreD
MRFMGSVVFFTLLISLQTTVFSNLSCVFSLYDILIPPVVYITLFRPYKTELPAIFIAGFVMDFLSAAPMGFYLITYTAIFLIFQKSKKYFHVRNMGLFLTVSIMGILIEYFVFSLLIAIPAMTLDISILGLQTLVIQVAWAAVTVPFIYLILSYGFKRFDQLIIRGFRPGM